MSTTPCKDCGAPVSPKAEACPSCGRQRPGGGVSSAVVITTVIIGVVVVLVVLGMAMESADSLR